MGQAFLLNDLSLAATITGSATLGDGAVANLKDAQPRTRARFSSSPCQIDIDLGSAVAVDVCALISTGLTAAATYRLRTSQADPTFAVTNSDTGGSPIAANTAPALNGQLVRIVAPSGTVRYIRWNLTDTTPIDVGKAPCGLLTRPARAFIYGHGAGFADGGIRDINARTGTHYGLDGTRARLHQFTLPRLSRTEATTWLRSLDRDFGLARDILFIPDTAAAAADLNAEAIFGAWKASGADATIQRTLRLFQRSFSLLERR